MPRLTATQGDDFVVEKLDRGYNKGPAVDKLKVNGTSGDVTLGALKVTNAGKASVGGVPVLTGGALLTVVAAGVAAAGPITATGAVVGDKVVAAVNLTTPAGAASSFEATITVVNQIQQTSASDLSASTFLFQILHQ